MRRVCEEKLLGFQWWGNEVYDYKPDTWHNLYVPRFYIECDFPIKIVKEEVYLGCILNEDLTDDNHIVKETRNNYIRGNMLIRKFRHCSIDKIV